MDGGQSCIHDRDKNITDRLFNAVVIILLKLIK